MEIYPAFTFKTVAAKKSSKKLWKRFGSRGKNDLSLHPLSLQKSDGEREKKKEFFKILNEQRSERESNRRDVVIHNNT